MALYHHHHLLFLLFCRFAVAATYPEGKTPGLFVFGSSLVDNGNNNFLPNASARANYRPYGIDSSMGPSGRFSNGKNMIDAFGELLGLRKPIPPFLDPRTRGPAVVHGVNYASGGSGILDETGSIGGRVMSLKEQITNFETITLPELKWVLGGRMDGNPPVDLSKYIFVVGTGGNDYLLNYYMKNKEAAGGSVTLKDFTTNLIATLYSHLKRLQGLGARKFMVLSVQAIGCVPVVRANLNSSSCVETINKAAVMFNTHLRSLVDLAGTGMPASHMIYVNSFDLIKDLFHRPEQKGFRETRTACCDVEGGNGILCREGGMACRDREKHVFFDGLHPTEAVNVWVAKRAYNSKSQMDVYPFNLRQLANI